MVDRCGRYMEGVIRICSKAFGLLNIFTVYNFENALPKAPFLSAGCVFSGGTKQIPLVRIGCSKCIDEASAA